MLEYAEIRKWFASDKWDIGHITKKQLMACSQMPIKAPSQPQGWQLTNDLNYDWHGICNGLVFIKQSSTSLDYSLYEEARDILVQHDLKETIDWGHLYLNFKEAEIFSGRGVRARNSLIYNYKFGFDSKICVIGFMKMIQNPPTIKRVPGNDFKNLYWKKCIGCDDCRKACPVGAIHNTEETDWLDSGACDDFIGMGSPDHPRIPSIKTFWEDIYKKMVKDGIVRSDINLSRNLNRNDTIAQIKLLKNKAKAIGYTNHQGITRKDGKIVSIPHCKECQVQPTCSKWGGKFPYETEGKAEWQQHA